MLFSSDHVERYDFKLKMYSTVIWVVFSYFGLVFLNDKLFNDTLVSVLVSSLSVINVARNNDNQNNYKQTNINTKI